jgi:hypothetical protein
LVKPIGVAVVAKRVQIGDGGALLGAEVVLAADGREDVSGALASGAYKVGPLDQVGVE